MKPFFRVLIIILSIVSGYSQTSIVDLVDPFIGSRGQGSCTPGPALPHSSIYPSPETHKCRNVNNAGYNFNEPIVGFSQTHAQGTGGVFSYGNFLISPQIGLHIKESEHKSRKENEIAKCYVYQVRLTDYNIDCEFSPTSHAAIYKFTFPESDTSSILIDVARKIEGAIALKEGSVSFNKKTNLIEGGGTFFGNWSPTEWEMYFVAEISKKTDNNGTWLHNTIMPNVLSNKSSKQSLGFYSKFKTKKDEEVYVKIAISFKSIDQAKIWLKNEIPAWDINNVKIAAKTKWEKTLNCMSVSGSSPADEARFYTSIFHANIQPRDRTGDNRSDNEPFWDDHYTIWDTWKTTFPFYCITAPDLVASNINSFIVRHKTSNSIVSDAFIQGKEFNVGQGGNDVDNVITDAYVKGIKGVNWDEAYQLLKYHADEMRTENYRNLGFYNVGEKTQYSHRMKSGSGSIAFAYNDYCIAQVAKGLGKTDDYNKYLQRSGNWKNVWDTIYTSEGYKGFILGRDSENKTYDKVDNAYYEGTPWIYSYVIPHDIAGLVNLMGGKQNFIDRLQFTLNTNKIDFTNEPSFYTVWLFSNPEIRRPDLTSFWVQKILEKYKPYSYPGDEDNGAMSTLYIFIAAGLMPVAGQDVYYLHGPIHPEVTFNLPNGKKFKIIGKDVSKTNIYIQSAKLNGKPLNDSWIHHNDIINGGKLEFVMGSFASNWGQ